MIKEIYSKFNQIVQDRRQGIGRDKLWISTVWLHKCHVVLSATITCLYANISGKIETRNSYEEGINICSTNRINHHCNRDKGKKKKWVSANQFHTRKIKKTSLIDLVLREVWWVPLIKTKQGRDMTVLKKDNMVGNSCIG